MMTGRAILRKKLHSQGGQAIAELGACIIALLVLILGVLLVSVMSYSNIDNTITSRTKADQNARSNTGVMSGNAAGSQISDWDYGENEIPFTGDDRAVDGSGLGQAGFSQKLKYSDTQTNDDGTVTFLSGPSADQVYAELPSETTLPVTALDSSKVFLIAANLVSGVSEKNDPLSDYSLSSLKSTLKDLFGIKTFRQKDETFMPPQVSLTEPENVVAQE